MLLVSCNEGSNAALIFVPPFGWLTVVSRTAYPQNASKLFSPPWLDFFQDG